MEPFLGAGDADPFVTVLVSLGDAGSVQASESSTCVTDAGKIWPQFGGARKADFGRIGKLQGRNSLQANRFTAEVAAIPGRVGLVVTQFLTLTNIFINQMVNTHV